MGRILQMTINKVQTNYGSFRDSLRAPIHRWFTYPAGYSHKFVKAKIDENNLTAGCWIADPFLGTGTTSLVGKIEGFNTLGVEAHPFVYWVAKTKMKFDYDLNGLYKDIENAIRLFRAKELTRYDDSLPALIRKCFSEDNLAKICIIKKTILESNIDSSHVDIMKLALTATLRVVTTAGSGWPYIAPSKYAEKAVSRDAFSEFEKQCMLMLSDLSYVHSLGIPDSIHKIVQGDARKLSEYTPPESIDLIVTSPPYLNNYDYADRTRLETYFWGIYDNWGAITKNVRDHLMIAATTQVRIGDMNTVKQCPTIQNAAPEIHKELISKINLLTEMRMIKPGKKTYDYMVAGYFEDMLKVIQESYVILKPGSKFVLVLGDSAPYGIYIPTEEVIGRLAVAVGFKGYQIEVIRKRGEKWANNPQRHNIPLKESILTIQK